MSCKDHIFTCTQCGFCCHGETTVSLDSSDQERMISALRMERSEVSKKYWRISNSTVQMKTVHGHCIFYDEGCTVYTGRPWRCAQWPLVPALLHDPASFTAISASCPGINKTLSYETFRRLLQAYLDKKKG